jgi:hypothetical protein
MSDRLELTTEAGMAPFGTRFCGGAWKTEKMLNSEG